MAVWILFGVNAMLNKLNIYCWLVALSIIILGAFYLNYQNGKIEKQAGKIDQLTKDKESLTLNLEKRNNDIVALSKRNKELEASAKKDTSGFDWTVNISNSPVVNQLQEQCVSCPK